MGRRPPVKGKMYLYRLLVLLLDLLTFTRRENLLNQFLDGVIVDRVCVDVTAELVEVPTLPTQTVYNEQDIHSDALSRVQTRSTRDLHTVLPQGPKTNDNVLLLHLFLLCQSPVRNSRSSGKHGQ